MTSRYDEDASWWQRDGLEINDATSTYIASLYWATTTITTVRSSQDQKNRGSRRQERGSQSIEVDNRRPREKSKATKYSTCNRQSQQRHDGTRCRTASRYDISGLPTVAHPLACLPRKHASLQSSCLIVSCPCLVLPFLIFSCPGGLRRFGSYERHRKDGCVPDDGLRDDHVLVRHRERLHACHVSQTISLLIHTSPTNRVWWLQRVSWWWVVWWWCC